MVEVSDLEYGEKIYLNLVLRITKITMIRWMSGVKASCVDSRQLSALICFNMIGWDGVIL